MGRSKLKGKEEGYDMVVPDGRYMLQFIEHTAESHNDRWCVLDFM